MFAVSNLILAVAKILDLLFSAMYWLILIRALLSWFSPDPYNPLVRFLNTVTEPVLYPIRKILPPALKFGIDISPLAAIFAIYFLRLFLIRTLVDLAIKIR